MSVFVLLMNNIFLRIKLFSRKFIDKYLSRKFIDKYLYPVRREDGNDKHNDRIYENYGYDYNYDYAYAYDLILLTICFCL